jgi:hypothetical protein
LKVIQLLLVVLCLQKRTVVAWRLWVLFYALMVTDEPFDIAFWNL